MEQNSNEWLEWRKKGIGASDAPIIMGVSPYKTPRQLLREKLGLEESQGNWATQRGHNLENQARATFELEMDMDFEPTLAQHTEYEWLRASLDGYNAENKAILEIKCPGKDDHKTAASGKVPEKYWPQLQHQFLVTGAKKAYYYSYDGETGHIVVAEPDQSYIEKLLYPKLVEFYGYMQRKEMPPLTDEDTVEIDDEKALYYAQEYAAADAKIKELQDSMKNIKKELLKFVNHPKAKVGKLTISKFIKQGSVDYNKVPQLKDVDLDNYRKKATEVITIRVNK